ncbi:MAG: Cna B-type domain-containing protein, partial [Clostridiales bacterium]|nr:Cna B-type domain-containing protein [Clostridiales bacterium]
YDIDGALIDGWDSDDNYFVSITPPEMPDDIEGEELSLLYIPDPEAVFIKTEPVDSEVTVTETGFEFEVGHFSVYAITATATNNGVTVTLPDNTSISLSNPNPISRTITIDAADAADGVSIRVSATGWYSSTYIGRVSVTRSNTTPAVGSSGSNPKTFTIKNVTDGETIKVIYTTSNNDKYTLTLTVEIEDGDGKVDEITAHVITRPVTNYDTSTANTPYHLTRGSKDLKIRTEDRSGALITGVAKSGGTNSYNEDTFPVELPVYTAAQLRANSGYGAAGVEGLVLSQSTFTSSSALGHTYIGAFFYWNGNGFDSAATNIIYVTEIASVGITNQADFAGPSYNSVIFYKGYFHGGQPGDAKWYAYNPTGVLHLIYEESEEFSVVYNFTKDPGTPKLPAAITSARPVDNNKYREGFTVNVLPPVGNLTSYYDAAYGGTWYFEGWTSNDADVSGGTFAMPNSDVMISGNWTFTSGLGTSVAVKKLWAHDTMAVRPSGIQVELRYASTNQKVELVGITNPVSLNANNGWTYTWEGLPEGNYVVEEATILSGYSTATSSEAWSDLGGFAVYTSNASTQIPWSALGGTGKLDNLLVAKQGNTFFVWSALELTPAQKANVKNAVAAAQSSFSQIAGSSSVQFAFGYGEKTWTAQSCTVEITTEHVKFDASNNWSLVLVGKYTAGQTFTITNTFLGHDVVLKKVDEAGRALAGASFKLEIKDFNVWKPINSGDEDGLFRPVITGTEALVTISAMIPGLYRISEVDAPLGYNNINGYVYFKLENGQITLTDENGTALGVDAAAASLIQGGSVGADGTEMLALIATNTTSYELPETGGGGAALMCGFGLTLLIGGISALLIYEHRNYRRKYRLNIRGGSGET